MFNKTLFCQDVWAELIGYLSHLHLRAKPCVSAPQVLHASASVSLCKTVFCNVGLSMLFFKAIDCKALLKAHTLPRSVLYGKMSKVISIDDTRITHANDSGRNTFHPNRIN